MDTGYANAADWVYRRGHGDEGWAGDTLVTWTDVREIHRLAMTPVWDVAPHPNATAQEGPGNFRRHDINPFQGGMQPPPSPEIAAAVSVWLDHADALTTEPPSALPERLAAIHAQFERIHPFLEGNGPTGRLVTNLLLVGPGYGYPPAINYKRDREKYLRALVQADAGDVGSLGELFARAILDNLHRFVLPAVAGPARLVPLQVLADAELSVQALGAAARRGRLRAQRGADGGWRSSRNWVVAYRADRVRRRP